MDKLRAMEYFVHVVEAGGFAAAARRLDVSPPAVTQKVAALERRLGTTLLQRDSRHVALTPDGEEYYEVCRRMLADLGAAELRLAANRTRVSGKLVVGVARILANHCIAPALPEFLARHKDLKIDLRIVHTPQDPGAAHADVLLLIAWPEQTDRVVRRIAQTRFVTCASPGYWQAHGIPRDPDQLRSHHCLAYRLSRGVVLDLWKYQRDGVIRSVAIEPLIVSDDRDSLLEAAVRGAGVVRISDLSSMPWFEDGSLQPVLEDWEGLEAPPIHVSYRRGVRWSARVRVFVEFVTDVFRRLEASRVASGHSQIDPVPMPAWIRSKWAGPLTRRVPRS